MFEMESRSLRLEIVPQKWEDDVQRAEIILDTRLGVLKHGDALFGIEHFITELEGFHQSLTGTPTLRGYHGFSMAISHKSRGHIAVDVSVSDPMADDVEIRMHLEADQSYLPRWIATLKSAFQTEVLAD